MSATQSNDSPTVDSDGSLAGVRAELRQRLASQAFGYDETEQWIDVIAPATGEVIGRVPHGTPDDIVAAVRAARAVQRIWKKTPFKERAKILKTFHDLVLSRQDEVLDILQLETGKTRMHAFEEVLDTAITSRYYANTGPKVLKPHRRRGAIAGLTAAYEYHHPRGIVGFIVPWNYPLSLGISDALPAIMAGNGGVIKPDAQTPTATLWAVDLLEEAGLPQGLIQVVTGDGAELGPTITGTTDFVMFTGSTRVGKIVATQAAERLIEFSMELGGKNAMIVMPDADLEMTVERGLRACFSNAGQLCISMERMYVHESIFDEFTSAFAEGMRALKIGGELDYRNDIGSLISGNQFNTVQTHVDDAVAKGATVVAGGKARPDIGPYFYEPTLLTGVHAGMTLYKDETFGPVVSAYPFSTVEEVIELANDSEYGLNFSLWTRDTRRGREIATQLEAGTICINEGYASGWGSVDAPMGGYKTSGTGRRHGEHGITKYCESQNVSIQRLLPLSAPPSMPGDKYAHTMSTLLGLLRRTPGTK